MTTTGEKIVALLPSKPTPRQQGNVWRSASPLRPDSDGLSFSLRIDADGEHGCWHDFNLNGGEGGSLYELADRLGIERPQNGKDSSADTSTIVYQGLGDYAAARGVTREAFEAAGWRAGTHHGRPALLYPVRVNGEQVMRARFLDGQHPKYIWCESGRGTAVWYGLERAVTLARELPSNERILYVVNGEASVVVAQHHGIPAAATTGGEGAFHERHARELLEAWDGMVAIALDCDETGRHAAQERLRFLPDAVVVDLKLHRGGDVADFCALYGDGARDALLARTPRSSRAEAVARQPFVGIGDMVHVFEDVYQNNNTAALEVLPASVPMEWPPLAHLFGPYVAAGKVAIYASTSGSWKTMLAETYTQHNMLENVPTLLVSPEWYPAELLFRMARRVFKAGQRAHEPAFRIPTYHEWLRDIDRRRRGMPTSLQPAQIEALLHAMRVIRTQAKNLDVQNIRASSTNIRQIFDDMLQRMHVRDKAGLPPIRVVFLDYLSVLDLNRPADNRIEEVLNRFKEFCMRHNVFGITTSQVTKEAVRRVYVDGGELYATDIYGAREDKSNYIIMGKRHLMTGHDMVARGMMTESEAHERTKGKLHRPVKDARGQYQRVARWDAHLPGGRL